MEIKGLFSVGGDRRQSWKVENLRLMRMWPIQIVSGAFFVCVFPWFCSTLSRCLLKLCAVYAESQQGRNNSSSVLLCEGTEEITQIVVILEWFVSNMPQL